MDWSMDTREPAVLMSVRPGVRVPQADDDRILHTSADAMTQPRKTVERGLATQRPQLSQHIDGQVQRHHRVGVAIHTRS
jgi:hypothetical protein